MPPSVEPPTPDEALDEWGATLRPLCDLPAWYRWLGEHNRACAFRPLFKLARRYWPVSNVHRGTPA